jgi:signal transduction histidine kinase
LRRVATLVARGVSPADVFAATAIEVGRLLDVETTTLSRYRPNAKMTLVGADSNSGIDLRVGSSITVEGENVAGDVLRTGRASRRDGFDDATGPIAKLVREWDIRSAVGAPIVVDGQLWGLMVVSSRGTLPADTEQRLVDFTDLVATAIANAESRAALGRLVDEQAALRRMATLVAHGVPSEEIFAAVTEEVGQLLPVTSAAMGRCDPDGMFTTVAAWSTATVAFPVGRRWAPGGKNVMTIVFETERPARMDYFAGASGPVGVAAREAGYRSAVGTPIIVEGRLWGVMTAASSAEQSLPADTEARLASFTDLVATAIANTESREALGQLAEEQAALRRVATLVAQGVQSAALFSAVSEEVAGLFASGAGVLRYDHDGPAIVFVGAAKVEIPIGTRWEFQEGMASAEVYRTGRAARVDSMDWSEGAGPVAATARRVGVLSTVASPIVVEGRLWGAITISSPDEVLPADTEERLENFTELVATAIANAESRGALGRLAEQQAALRRVATLVAEGVPPARVFAALSEEVGLLVDAEAAVIGRLEADGRVTVLAVSGTAVDQSLLGTEFDPEPNTVLGVVARTGRSARMDDYSEASDSARRLGIRSGVAVPIVVGGAPWGVVAIGTVRERFPDDTAQRLEEFTELAATAVANAETRSELAASRARVVAASDETRRRIERDLHDGTQQRLVSLALALRLAEANVPPELDELRAELSHTADGLAGAVEDLQEISRGIHPAILAEGGLAAALKTLARRSAVPVELDVRTDRRLPEQVEVAAYYLVSEALTNAAKHAHASVVHVDVDAEDSIIQLAIHDDGVGGADPAQGSGLIGLSDRVEALGGRIEIASPAGHGTSLLVRIPLEGD